MAQQTINQTSYAEIDPVKLTTLIVQYFNVAELTDLTFELRIDYEELAGARKTDKVKALVGHFERRRRTDLLLAAVREERPHVDWSAVALQIGEDLPPFKGLQAFDEEDADIFFGRDGIVSDLIKRLSKGGRFLALVGASGSGKSSLVSAGVLPLLRRARPLEDGTLPPRHSDGWPIHTITPGANPLESLATTLTRKADSISVTTTLIEDLQADEQALHLYVRRLLSNPDEQGRKRERLLLFIDQFEEIFTLTSDEVVRRAFIANLMTAVSIQEGPVIVVITLRADFYANCSQYEQLREQLESSQKFLGPMTEDELRLAIEAPAEGAGYEFEPGLVETILREIGNEPGALPLLSHALLETWKRRRGFELTFEGYTEAGGIRGAIAKTADTVYEYNLDPEQQRIARLIFINLTEVGETQDTRRHTPLTTLYSVMGERRVVDEVLSILTNARLVLIGQDTAEVTHEALIREWPTLRRWLDENREGLRIYRQLQVDARQWVELDQDRGALYRGMRLARAMEWYADHEDGVDSLSKEFLERSRRVALQEKAARERQQRRELEAAQKLAEAQRERAEEQATAAKSLKRNYQRSLLLAGLAVVSTVVSIFFFFQANQQKKDAEIAREQAEVAKSLAEQQSRISQAETTAARANASFYQSPQLSLLLAVESLNNLLNTDPSVPEPVGALWNVLTRTGGFNLGRHETGAVSSLAISADGRWLVSGGEDATIYLYDTTQPIGVEPVALIGNEGPVFSAAISPNNLLITGGWNGNLNVWDLSWEDPSGSFILLETGGGTVNSIAFSNDNRWLITGSDDSNIYLWDVDDLFEPVHVFSGHTGTVTDLAFSPDGQTFLSGGDDGLALLWDANNWQASPQLLSRTSTLVASLFADSAVSSSNEPATNSHSSNRTLPVLSELLNGAIYAVAFSLDGEQVAIAGGTPPWVNANANDYEIAIWKTADPDGAPLILSGHSNLVTDIAFTPDSRSIVSTSWDETVRIWHLRNLDLEPQILYGHEAHVTRAVISPDGGNLYTGSGDHTVRQWNLSFPLSAPLILRQHNAWLNIAAISPNDAWIATGGDDNRINLWQFGGIDLPPQTLLGHTKSVLALAFSPDSRWLASGSEDNTIVLWDLASQDLNATAITLRGHTDWVNQLVVTPDSKWLASASYDGTIRLWDLTAPTANPIVLDEHNGPIYTLVLSDDGKWLVSGGEDGIVRLWGLDNPGTDLRLLTGHGASINSAAISHDSCWLLTGSSDHTARIWDLTEITETAVSPANCQPVISPDGHNILNTVLNRVNPSVPLVGHTDSVRLVSITADNQLFATTSLDNTTRLWHLFDLANSRATLRGHTRWVTAMATSHDSQWLVTGGYDNRVQLWNLNDPAIGALTLPGHSDEITALIFSQNDDWLVTASGDHTVRLWTLNIETLKALACRIANRNLTVEEMQQYLPGQPLTTTCENLPISTGSFVQVARDTIE